MPGCGRLRVVKPWTFYEAATVPRWYFRPMASRLQSAGFSALLGPTRLDFRLRSIHAIGKTSRKSSTSLASNRASARGTEGTAPCVRRANDSASPLCIWSVGLLLVNVSIARQRQPGFPYVAVLTPRLSRTTGTARAMVSPIGLRQLAWGQPERRSGGLSDTVLVGNRLSLAGKRRGLRSWEQRGQRMVRLCSSTAPLHGFPFEG
jgi:hypothetical protein